MNCVGRIVTGIEFNSRRGQGGRLYVGEMYMKDDKSETKGCIVGPGQGIMESTKEGEQVECVRINEFEPGKNPGDRWYYDVEFSDGDIIRVFNPNIVRYKTGK